MCDAGFSSASGCTPGKSIGEVWLYAHVSVLVSGEFRATISAERASRLVLPSVFIAFCKVRKKRSFDPALASLAAFDDTRRSVRCYTMPVLFRRQTIAELSSSPALWSAAITNSCSSSARSLAATNASNSFSVSSLRSKEGMRPAYREESQESTWAQSCASARCWRAFDGEKRALAGSETSASIVWLRTNLGGAGADAGTLTKKASRVFTCWAARPHDASALLLETVWTSVGRRLIE